MKVIVDAWGDRVKPWDPVQARDGAWYTITDLVPEDERFQVGAVFEGGCEDDDGDFFPASFFDLKVIEMDCDDPSGWRQEAFKQWAE